MTVQFVGAKLEQLKTYIVSNIFPVLQQFALYLGRLSLLRYVANNVRALVGTAEGLGGALLDTFTSKAVFEGLEL